MSQAKERLRKEFSERLKKAVKFRGLPLHGCKKHLERSFRERGVSISSMSIGRWFSADTMPSTSNLTILSEILGVSFDWLSNGRGEMVSELAITRNGEVTKYIAHRIPHLEPEHVHGWMNGTYKAEKTTMFFGDAGDKAFAVTLQDQSLHPDFSSGTVFVVDPSRIHSKERPVFAMVDGVGVFGYPVNRPAKIMIEPINLSYRPIEVNSKQIIGSVIATAERILG